MSGILLAANHGDIAKMKRLLAEGADINEVGEDGSGVLQYAALAGSGNFAALSWLLVEGGASIGKVGIDTDRRVWGYLCVEHANAVELSSLLRVMVMLEDAPADFIARLMPQHAELCERGRQLRAQLPSYLEQQRATIVTNCHLPAVLQSLVIAYAVTTPEDMWADGLLAEAQREKRARAVEREAEGSHVLRRSARLRQKPE
jgi:hypothetical protein